MADSYPNHFLSIPRSVGSLKHYFSIHDQPLTRSLIYLVLLALLIALLSLAVSLVGYLRDARSMAEELEPELGAVAFADGAASAEGDQPRILWEKTKTLPSAEPGPGGAAESKERTVRLFLLVLDTEGTLETVEQAAEFAGCPQSKRLLFFGTERIESIERGTGPRGGDAQETYEYSDVEKLGELRKLIEASGGSMPRVALEGDVATFAFPALRALLHTDELLVLVDTGEEQRSLAQALAAAEGEEPVPLLVMTGGVDRVEPARELAEGAGRVLFFGPKAIESYEGPVKLDGEPAPQSHVYTDEAVLAELRALVEEQGGAFPEFTVEDGAATFALRAVHVLAHTAELMVLVDASGETRSMQDAAKAALDEDEAFRDRIMQPEFLALITGSEAQLQSRYGPEVRKLAFADAGELSAASVAGWLATVARKARTSATLRLFLPELIASVLFLFFGAVFASLAGLLASGRRRGGLAYGEILNIAVYATTPGLLAFLVAAMVLRGQGGMLVLALGVGVAMVYTALGTQRTLRELDQGMAPTI
jgi:hypothetical protein